MTDIKHRVAIIGCGRLGQQYAEAYSDFPETEIVALAEHNPERRRAVGERFGVKALYADAESLLRDVVPDVAAVVTPTKYYKDAVIACAEAGVKGVSCDKPIAGVLADADEMVRVCEERGVVFAGGNLQRAMSEVREAAKRIHSGALGEVEGVALHGWGIQISGGGCQHISVLRLFTGAEVDEVIAWATPQEAWRCTVGGSRYRAAAASISRCSGSSPARRWMRLLPGRRLRRRWRAAATTA